MKRRSWGNATGYEAQREEQSPSNEDLAQTCQGEERNDAKAASIEKPAELRWSLHFTPRDTPFPHAGCAKTAQGLQDARLKVFLCLKLPGVCRAAAFRQSLLFAPRIWVVGSKPWGEMLLPKGSQRKGSDSLPSWLESSFSSGRIRQAS